MAPYGWRCQERGSISTHPRWRRQELKGCQRRSDLAIIGRRRSNPKDAKSGGINSLRRAGPERGRRLVQSIEEPGIASGDDRLLAARSVVTCSAELLSQHVMAPAGRLHDPAKGVLDRDAERLGELPKGQDGYVVLAALHAADVGAVDLRLERQFRVRPAALFADLPQILTQPTQRRVFLSCHTLKVRF